MNDWFIDNTAELFLKAANTNQTIEQKLNFNECAVSSLLQLQTLYIVATNVALIGIVVVPLPKFLLHTVVACGLKL